MRYHLFQKFFGKMVKIKETSFLSTRGIILMFGNCMWKRRRFIRGRRQPAGKILPQRGSQGADTPREPNHSIQVGDGTATHDK